MVLLKAILTEESYKLKRLFSITGIPKDKLLIARIHPKPI